MGVLRNLPVEEAKQLSHLISVRPHQVVSMALTKSEKMQMTLFAFDRDESVSEEAYIGDTLYVCIEGMILIKIGENTVELQTGEVFCVEAGILHAVSGKDAFKMLQITVNE